VPSADNLRRVGVSEPPYRAPPMLLVWSGLRSCVWTRRGGRRKTEDVGWDGLRSGIAKRLSRSGCGLRI